MHDLLLCFVVLCVLCRIFLSDGMKTLSIIDSVCVIIVNISSYSRHSCRSCHSWVSAAAGLIKQVDICLYQYNAVFRRFPILVRYKYSSRRVRRCRADLTVNCTPHHNVKCVPGLLPA